MESNFDIFSLLQQLIKQEKMELETPYSSATTILYDPLILNLRDKPMVCIPKLLGFFNDQYE
jgi:hypothetical protein